MFDIKWLKDNYPVAYERLPSYYREYPVLALNVLEFYLYSDGILWARGRYHHFGKNRLEWVTERNSWIEEET